VTPSGAFKDAMARFPSGVTITTTVDGTGRWWGFTASSFCSVSADPPLVLVCLANGAECRAAFVAANRWNIHIIHPDHTDLAVRFATRGANKFADAGFYADEHEIPQLPQACVTLHCSQHANYQSGDHTILVGHVDHTEIADTHPALYYRRAFHAVF
jgi:flavin reductase ActVB